MTTETAGTETTVLRHCVRSGAYHDSIVLMRLQSSLANLDGVEDAGAVMATATNLALLRSNRLLPDPVPQAGADDLLISVRAESEAQAEAAMRQIDPLLAHRNSEGDGSWRPRSLRGASRLLPAARWVLISVPGRFAAELAREALESGRHVFLYSDNVSLPDERQLKQMARDRGLLVLGPDCGTAMIGGTGLGFANRVRRGPVGLIAASGTGLQAVSSRVHTLGGGISHAIGTGGRDLHLDVGAITTLQALTLLAEDPWTRVIGLISKPPSAAVAAKILRAASRLDKPVVVGFLGYPSPGRRLGNLHFARDLEEVADLAVGLVTDAQAVTSAHGSPAAHPPDGSEDSPSPRRYLRGLFSGGTLAYEALLSFRPLLQPITSNLRAEAVELLEDPTRSKGHCIVDLGADELTVGRLHPMMDPDAARRRLLQEADDPEAAVILVDLVLGDVAHEDPASSLAETVASICNQAEGPRVILAVVGTEQDPQGLEQQIEAFRSAGAIVSHGLRGAVEACLQCLPADPPAAAPASTQADKAVDPADLEGPISAWNVGLETLYDSLAGQGSEALQVEWRPPAGGNERLAALLKKLT